MKASNSIPRALREKNGALLLENGSLYAGLLVGAKPSKNSGFGEVIFNTALAGYQEVLTDPSYWQQIVVMTYPHQGNYGINEGDNESQGGPKVGGFVMGDITDTPSNFAAKLGLEEYLSKWGVAGLSGVDTRKLTLEIRSSGAMRGLILSLEEAKKSASNASKLFSGYPKFEGRDLILEVTTKKPYWFSEKGAKTVVAYDFGVKTNILRELASRGARVVVVPATTTADEALAYKPDGIFLSNGPGDPAEAKYAIEAVRGLLGKKPLFGVCMGHQILSLALGAKTFKMKFGHRGVNQPVLREDTKQVEISSHNHGYAVDTTTLPAGVVQTHVNLNDRCCEGISCEAKMAFSVQYHPESAPGPHDSSYLFDKFARMLS